MINTNSGHRETLRTKGQWARRNSKYRRTVSTKEQWVQGTVDTGTMDIEVQWAQRYSGHWGTVSTEEQWAHRNSRHRETVSTKEQWEQRNSGHRGQETSWRTVFPITFPQSHSVASMFSVYWPCCLESSQQAELTEMKHYTQKDQRSPKRSPKLELVLRMT